MSTGTDHGNPWWSTKSSSTAVDRASLLVQVKPDKAGHLAIAATILLPGRVCTQNRLDRTTTRPTRPAAMTIATVFVEKQSLSRRFYDRKRV